MYDKDAEDENMMDNLNDDNSMFDFPGDGNNDTTPNEPINDENVEIGDVDDKELVYVEPEDAALDYQDESGDDIEDIDEISIIDQDSFMQGESLDDIANEANYEAESPAKKSADGKILLLVVPLLIVILLAGLLWVYAVEWNVPVLADLKKKTTVTEIKEKDVNNVDVEGLEAEGEQNDDLAGLLNQEADDSDMVVRRQSAVEDEIPQLPMPGMANGEGNLPPLPGAENGQRGANSQVAQGQRTYYTGHIGRLDPFNPTGGSSQLFDIVAPPTNPTPDTEAQQLLSLRISGIMYTADSPSAIINIAGQDQLVRRGDKFNGFSVERITQDKVTVRNGSNTYTASVGESFNIKDVAGINAIPNLNNKFAGPYSKGKGRIIEINTLN